MCLPPYRKKRTADTRSAPNPAHENYTGFSPEIQENQTKTAAKNPGIAPRIYGDCAKNRGESVPENAKSEGKPARHAA
jgi:hypothetical protein